jgi:hypothetical protein
MDKTEVTQGVRRALVVGGAIVLFGAVLAFLAVLSPSGYRPARLDYNERQTAAKQFYRQMMDFDDRAQSNAAFEFVFTAEQLNRYLASMDEIAAMLPEGYSGRVQEMLSAAGLSAPAVAITEGRMTLMVRSSWGLVVSADLSPGLDEQGRLFVPLRAVRLGRLGVPQVLVRHRLRQTRDKLLALHATQRSDKDVPGGLEAADLAAIAANYAMQMVLAALDGQPIVPEGKYHRHRIRLAAIELGDGQMTVHVIPIPRKPS